MRKLLKRIIQVLDGTPAVYGRRERGQSLVEMAFITPLLIILIAGIAEMGWLANNYLIMLEVTRVGARRGTILTADNSPIGWEHNEVLSLGTQLPGKGLNTGTPSEVAAKETMGVAVRNCSNPNTETQFGFYNLIACQMLNSLDPLPFRIDTNPLDGISEFDDIIVSAFALQRVNNPNDFNFTSYPGTHPPGDYVYVVGRYPSNANECTVDTAGGSVEVERDPFDYIKDNARNCINCATNPIWLELGGGDDYTNREKQRGFVWTGQHKVTVDAYNPTALDCYGSQFTVARIEELMNLPGFDLNAEQRRFLPPSQGLVLVEMYWRHELLLAFPLFSPIYNILGENTVLSVWAAFPAPGAEPNIQFN